MSTPGIGSGAFERGELLRVASGTMIGLEGRYEIIHLHYSTERSPFPYGYASYLARDTKDSRFVLIRIHCETDTELMTEPININNESGAFLLPCASFKHERRPCFVYELHGPELYDLTHFSGEDCNLPANWIHKVFKEALTALALLHKQGIVHGSIQLFSLVITYPALNATDEDAVRQFYSSSHELGWTWNSTGSGDMNSEPGLDFQLKLQDFSTSFHTTERVNDPFRYLLFHCSPPELVIERQVGPETDIWYLAEIFANFIAGMVCFSSILPRASSDHSENPQVLRQTERILGPLPANYSRYLPPSNPSPYEASDEEDEKEDSPKSLLDIIRDGRNNYRDEEEALETYGSKDFSDAETCLAVDLLSHMLDYDTKKRYTAQQALQHEFFSTARPQ